MQEYEASLVSKNIKSQSSGLGLVVSRGGGSFQLSQPCLPFSPSFLSLP